MQFGGGRASLSRPPSATTSAGEGSKSRCAAWLCATRKGTCGAIGARLVAWIGVLAIALLLPLATGPYVTTFVFALITALVLAQSWDWVGGQMGYINLGHFAFYGIGAYTLRDPGRRRRRQSDGISCCRMVVTASSP